jgi:hypothetical protein
MAATQSNPVERPIAAFVLSLLAGLGLLARSAMMNRWSHWGGHGGMHGGMDPWMSGGFAMGSPWIATIAGLALIVAAVGLYVRPDARRSWGIAILMASGLALLFGMGGLIAGVLGLVAGALAVLGNPPGGASTGG